jgi:transcriptional regulator with XRE-family HTH domain
MLTPKQSIAARALLGWTQKDLEAATHDKRTGERVSAVTIGEFERGQTDPKVSTLLKLQRALERGGIIFIEPTAEHGPGLMLREGRKT